MPHYLDYTTVDEAAAKTDVPIWRDGAFAGEFGVSLIIGRRGTWPALWDIIGSTAANTPCELL